MIFLLLILGINFQNTISKTKIECGYKQCPQTREGALNVHIIPHSHMDAGWVKTFDEYYYGTKTAASTANVQLIYHSVLSELLHDKHRKFTFSETAYFWRWWKEQRATTRATFRTLVQEGRVQFAGGAWVQNDEATADYLQIIDQFTWGLRKLNDTLGPCGIPKAAWQIDTYGHTREQASLLAQMGYDGLFIGRVDHKVREAMMDEDRMEFMWRGSDVLGKMSDIMTHTLFNLYNAPDGFCFDFLCSDEPIVDDPDSRVYNAEKRVNDFITQIEKQAKYYDHDNILVTMGGDFTYQSAANWFMNIDKIISHVNSHSANMSDINIFYSTPSCYLKAIYLYGKRDKALYTEKSDHLPYGSDSSTYWTGFYTSRPSLKYFVRKAHIFLQIVKQLTVISRMADSYELHSLRHAIGLMLHHDVITGTSQQHVINDFTKTLSEAVEACTRKVSQSLSILTPSWGGSRRSKINQQFVVCHQLNVSQCRFIETQESVLLLVYNPLSVKTYHHVRLPAIALHYSIRDYNDEEVEYQLVSLPAPIINMPGRASTAIQELYFEAENIPPLGYTAYFITAVRDPLEENAYVKKSSQPGASDPDQELTPYISNEYLKVTVDKTTGLLESVQHIDGAKVQLSQNFYFYSQGQQTLQSGAYAFRPREERPAPISDKAMYYTVRGSLVKEIRQRFNDWVTQIIRLYRGEEFVELEWIIGPVPVGNDLGKEVVTIFKTNISNNGDFFTDSNSRQMMKRNCWNKTSSTPQKKPVPACYYPVTSRICLQSLNSSVEMCVLTDRTQGGTSYDEGELELMMHRRLLTDDGFGLEESLNEDAFGVGLVVKGKHRIFLGNYKQEVDEQTFSERTSQVARKWIMEPWLFLTTGEKINRRKWQNVRNKRFSSLRLHGLPRHIHVLSFEPWKAGSVLLRLENTLEKSRPPFRRERDTREDYSKFSHITVDLRKIFLQMKIKKVREATLAANQWLEDARQMDWSTRYVYIGADDGILPEDLDYPDDGKPVTVHYSDEETEAIKTTITRRRNYEKGKHKMRPPTRYETFESRNKRSINITENIINGSENLKTENENDWTTIVFNETVVNQGITENVTEINNNDLNVSNKEINLNNSHNNTTSNVNNTSNTDSSTESKIYVTYPRTESKKNKSMSSDKIRKAKFLKDFRKDSSEIEAEHSVSNRRLQDERRRGYYDDHMVENEADLDDEGITKSIYEMYYKVRPRKSAFKPHIRHSEETTELPRKAKNRRFKKNDGTASCERDRRTKNRRRGRAQNIDIPFFITNRSYNYDRREERDSRRVKERGDDGESYSYRRGVDTRPKKRTEETTYISQEYETGSNEGGEMESYDREDYTDSRRKKRATDKEDYHADSSETGPDTLDYVVTLRPTQIRTFVIWFEDKKSYTL
ncbi:lysosomal alpha-mannosidase-like [Epargyreus clarus]|uniref:lysosomal alpha-mannosidase-like n=1 Tax=Epargyreus clarus TaxID=520877 RepID=UPI003C2F73C0